MDRKIGLTSWRTYVGLALIVGAGFVAAQAQEKDADKNWRVIEGLIKNPPMFDPPEFAAGVDFTKLFVIEVYQPQIFYRERLRNVGLNFFDKNPNDPRRWDWFIATCFYEPWYFADIQDGARVMARDYAG